MYGLAFSILKNPQMAEDAVQYAFTKLLAKYTVLSNLSKPQEKAYILTTVANAAKDLAKKENKNIPLESPIATIDHYESESDLEITLEKNIKNANSTTVIKAIETLPPHYQDVLILFYYLELTLQECADILEIKKETFRKRKSTALSALAKELQERGLTFEE